MAIVYQRHLGTTGSTPSSTLSVTNNPAGGVTSSQILVGVLVAYDVSDPTITAPPTVTDSRGNTYVLDASKSVTGGTDRSITSYIFRCQNATPLAPGDTIQFNIATGYGSAVCIVLSADEFTGLTALDQTVTKSFQDSPFSSTDAKLSLTTTAAPEAVYAAIAFREPPGTSFNVASGTQTGAQSQTSTPPSETAFPLSAFTLYQIANSIGTFTSEVLDLSGNNWCGASASYSGTRDFSATINSPAVVQGFNVYPSATINAPALVKAAGNNISATVNAPAVIDRAHVATPDVTFTGTDGIFTRIGHLGGLLNLLNSHRRVDVPAHLATIVGDYPSTDHEDLIEGIYSQFASYEQDTGLAGFLKTLAQSVLVTMMDDDVKLPSATVEAAATELVRQMVRDGKTVSQPTTGYSLTAGSGNAGNAVVILSLVRPDGTPMLQHFAEHMSLTVTGDSFSGTASLGNEILQAQGERTVDDTLRFDWPGGSGTDTSVVTVDPADQSALVQDGGFEGWSGSPAALGAWTLTAGAWGTHVLQGTSPYKGTSCLQFTGDGATLAGVTQKFDPTAGTALQPNTVFVLNAWVKATGALSGVVRIALKRANGTTVVNSDAGTANSLSLTLAAGAYSGWTAVNAVFCTPKTVSGDPANALTQLTLEQTTALNSGGVVLVDALTLTAITSPLYTGGPGLVVCAGSTPLVIGDSWRADVSNSWTATNFQFLCERFWGLRGLGLQLPASAGGPTVSDGLIV